jgi:hypothetical protein
MESKEKNAQKICENVAVDKTKSAYVIYEWPPRKRPNTPPKQPHFYDAI